MEESAIEMHKMRRIINILESARGAGTSMVSLILPPGEQISRSIKLLTTEYGTATNIKSRVNRLSVQSAIQSALVKLKSLNMNNAPLTGLALYSGSVLQCSIDPTAPKTKEKKISIAIEPLRPINTSLYLCDNRFHVEALRGQFLERQRYGVVVIDGQQCIFASLINGDGKIMQKLSVDLPKKHGRGGQSSVRFARLRVEKRNAYIKKCAETITSLYGPHTLPLNATCQSADNYAAFIFAGPADFKTELRNSAAIPVAVGGRIATTIDTNYGGEAGLRQAIEMGSSALSDLKLSTEKSVLLKAFGEISSGLCAVGQQEVLEALDRSAVESIIIFEDLEATIDSGYNGGEMFRIGDREPLVDYLMRQWEESKKAYKLILVTDKTAEGMQLVKGLGGVLALLKFPCNFNDREDGDESDGLGTCSEDDIF